MDTIEKIFSNSIKTKEKILKLNSIAPLKVMSTQISELIQHGNKILLCGNGGSAADAQHLAAEMLVRLRPNNNREGIAALALAQDTSTITACGNDFGYDALFERTLRSLGKKGDCLIAITTSGNSKNIILAMIAAQEMGIKVFGFLGCEGGKALQYCDEAFIVPSSDTGRIQEAHITGGHALMECVEDILIEAGYLNLQIKS
jgi:D-sedoheptulose 7-phosphate isomerase